MSDGSESAKVPPSIDLGEVEKLLLALEQDLARVKGGSQNIQALRDEVEALRATLGQADHQVVPARLQTMHRMLDGTVDTLEVDAIKVAGYVAQIGRLLGLT